MMFCKHFCVKDCANPKVHNRYAGGQGQWFKRDGSFRGPAATAAKTAAPYLDATDPALRYSACFICGYASLSLNRIADARRCLAGILDTPADVSEYGEDYVRAADGFSGGGEQRCRQQDHGNSEKRSAFSSA